LVEPPGSQEISLQVEIGDQVEITDEVQKAFENLVQALRGDDMQGYIYLPKCTKRTIDCTANGNCGVEHQAPCFIDYSCKIGKIE
jgi:hypothetical protein